ncbi:MAG: UDP-N-acetylglucosamine 2-epimerase [Bacteroidales bacterium]|nr:UDP-N-acetylglucosamine 2-epimerase [Bacteroidales bacterium]
MIDTLEANRGKAGDLDISEIIERNLIEGQDLNSKLQYPLPRLSTKKQGTTNQEQGTKNKERGTTNSEQSPHRQLANSPARQFALMTMHRPSNVDKKEVLTPLFRFLADEVTQDMPLIWPIHPRTQGRLKEFGLWKKP